MSSTKFSSDNPSIQPENQNHARFSQSSKYSETEGVRKSVLFHPIAIPDDQPTNPIEPSDQYFNLISNKKFKGRRRMWPGIILLGTILIVATVLIVMSSINIYEKAAKREGEVLSNIKRIDDGSNTPIDSIGLDTPGNPSKYPDRKCQHLDYLSKNNFIYARNVKTNDEVKIAIKGINWSGMETGNAIPYGLWDNSKNGTTVYQIVAFLARNKFNSVRLPLCVQSILENKTPRQNFINKSTNKAINVKDYRSLLKSIIEALAYRGISVLLDLHTLTTKETGELWYNDEVPEEKVLESIDILGKDLCSNKYWNIIGLDLKNEPAAANWGEGPADKDWLKGAKTLGNRMLKACSKWTAFVEGIAEVNNYDIKGEQFTYYDWWGGGLQKANDRPLVLSKPNKIVWSPHYYSPSVYPQKYFFESGDVNPMGGTISNFVERSDDDLADVVDITMNRMFGYLGQVRDEAIILGEFGGLYGNDKHPLKTTKRTIDFTIKNIVDSSKKYAGGYVWALNPESMFEYNPVDTYGRTGKHHTYGLVTDSWLQVRKEFLEGLEVMDQMEDLKPFPCIEDDD